jgi:hypothetical protein
LAFVEFLGMSTKAQWPSSHPSVANASRRMNEVHGLYDALTRQLATLETARRYSAEEWKARLPPEALETDVVLQDLQARLNRPSAARVSNLPIGDAVEAWGEEGWATVGRLCRFFDAMGMEGLDCPPPPRPPRPG